MTTKTDIQSIFDQALNDHRPSFNLPARAVEMPYTLARLRHSSSEGIIALWNMWRLDRHYQRYWSLWTSLERRRNEHTKAADHVWASQEKHRRMTKAIRDRAIALNRQTALLNHQQHRLLDYSFRNFGIPPLDPKSRSITKAADLARNRWSIGKWTQPVWEPDDRFDRQQAGLLSDSLHSSLVLVIDPHYSRPSIRKAIDKHLDEWAKSKLAAPQKHSRPRKDLFSDYARAYYLSTQSDMSHPDITRELFGRDSPSARDKARKYVICGQHLIEGRENCISDEETPGVHPQWDQSKKAMIKTAILRKRKQG